MSNNSTVDLKTVDINKQQNQALSITSDELQQIKLFVATPMYGGQCLFSTNKIETEDGLKTIKWVVNNKYSGKVKSFNFKTNTFEWKNITNWISRYNGIKGQPDTEKKWIKLKTNTQGYELVCTDDHKCAVIDNPIRPSIQYREAKDTLNRFLVRNPDQTINRKENPLLNEDQISCMIGSLLGDGSISKSGNFQSTHSSKQLEYIEYKQKIFGGSITEAKHKNSYSSNSIFTLRLPVNAQTKYLRDLIYIDGNKEISNILKYIDEKSLAFWYMDDGFIINPKSNNEWNYSSYAMLCTDSFSKDECQALCNLMQDKWGIKASPIKYKKYYRIAISIEGSKIFWRLISPYVCESMHYKFPKDFDHSNQTEINNNSLEYACSLVKNVKPYSKSSRLFDIEVEDNHNFICNGTLVHNCTGFYTKSLIKLTTLCQSRGIQMQFFAIFNESLITRARNYIADEFSRSDCTHLLFIDADIEFDPQYVLDMLIFATRRPHMDIITGPYPKKNISWEKIKDAVDQGVADENPFVLENFAGDFVFNPIKSGQHRLNEPIEVAEAGTGFMLIPRYVFEKFAKEYPEQYYKPDHVRTKNFDGTREIVAFFDTPIDPETKRYLSEDYMFCKWSRKIGFTVWMCPWMQLHHHGSYRFVGNLGAIASIGASATADITKLEGLKK